MPEGQTTGVPPFSIDAEPVAHVEHDRLLVRCANGSVRRDPEGATADGSRAAGFLRDADDVTASEPRDVEGLDMTVRDGDRHLHSFLWRRRSELDFVGDDIPERDEAEGLAW